MQYMMFVATDSTAERFDPAGDNIEEWLAEMTERGVRLGGDRLGSSHDATTVRRRGGEVLVTDGPFAETKESIAGYDILDCADLDEAIEIAGKHPMARFGQIEIRPIMIME